MTNAYSWDGFLPNACLVFFFLLILVFWHVTICVVPYEVFLQSFDVPWDGPVFGIYLSLPSNKATLVCPLSMLFLSLIAYFPFSRGLLAKSEKFEDKRYVIGCVIYMSEKGILKEC